MKKIIIPDLEKISGPSERTPGPEARLVCPSTCPFYCSDDVCSICKMGWAINGKYRFELKPGPNCPGPGEYVLEKITRPKGEKHFLRLHND